MGGKRERALVEALPSRNHCDEARPRSWPREAAERWVVPLRGVANDPAEPPLAANKFHIHFLLPVHPIQRHADDHLFGGHRLATEDAQVRDGGNILLVLG